MALTYEKIETKTISSAQASVTFSSIPATYTDLVLITNGKMVSGGGENSLGIQLNGDTGSNYSSVAFYGAGTTPGSSLRFNNGVELYVARMGHSTNTTSIIHLLDYSNTTTYKTVLARGASSAVIMTTAGSWRNTGAVNSVLVRGFGLFANFASGCTFTLYGIKAA